MRALILILFLAPAGPVLAAEPRRDVHGEWLTPGFNARVPIEARGDDVVCGRIIWLRDRQRLRAVRLRDPGLGS